MQLRKEKEVRTMDKAPAPNTSFEQEELRSITRSVGEIEWLLLILILLYHVFGGTAEEDKPVIILAMTLYVASIMGFRYSTFFLAESRWKLAVQTWIMTGFITFSLLHTGRLESPLLNTYLLVIITSALALGKITTLLELVLIAACIAFLGDYSIATEIVSLKYLAGILAVFAPFVLVAYITTMFASDIRFGMNKKDLPAAIEDLTAVVNMRGFAVIADRLFGQAVRHEQPFSLLVIECRNLREIDVDLGPKAGDALLVAVSKVIKEQLRHSDVLARQVGGELVALLPETPAAGALAAAGKIRAAVAANPLVIGGEIVRPDIGIGAASYSQNGEKLDLLMAHAIANMQNAASGDR
jgi:diguanylate cyclase (GGDEF)-like protein